MRPTTCAVSRALVLFAVCAAISCPREAAAARATSRVYGKARLSEPLAGSRIALLDEAGHPLFKVTERTGAHGTFSFEIPRFSRFRIAVSGGFCGGVAFDGTLYADVDGFESGSFVHVNTVTTLVSLHRDRHPGLSIAGAEADVKAFLGIPTSWNVGSHLDNRFQTYFDHGKLVAAASGAGPCGEVGPKRLAAYLGDLLDERDAGAPPHLFTGQVGDVTFPSFDEVIEKLAEGIAGGFSDAAFGWIFDEILNAIGIGSNSEVLKLLEQINEKLNELEGLVYQVLSKEAQTQAEIISDDALNAISRIEEKYTKLSDWAKLASDGKFAAKDDVDKLMAAILDENTGTIADFAIVNGAVAGSGPETGAISRWDGYLKTTKPFYLDTPDDRLVKIFDYYQGVQVMATNLIIEAYHATKKYPLPPNEVDEAAYYLGVYRQNLDGQLKKVHEVGTPAGTVLHTKKNRLYLRTPPDCAPEQDFPDELWKEGCENSCRGFAFNKLAGFDDWRLPVDNEMDDVVADYQEAKNRGEAGTSIFDWITAQGLGGFENHQKAMFTSSISGTTGWYWYALTDVGVQYTCDSAINSPGATNGCSEIYQRYVPAAGAWCVSDKGGAANGD